jgi:hypothetical protein
LTQIDRPKLARQPGHDFKHRDWHVGIDWIHGTFPKKQRIGEYSRVKFLKFPNLDSAPKLRFFKLTQNFSCNYLFAVLNLGQAPTVELSWTMP